MWIFKCPVTRNQPLPLGLCTQVAHSRALRVLLFEDSNLNTERLFASCDSVVRGKVKARMSELGKIGIGGFPRRQKVRVPCRGRFDVASLLAGHRYAIEREARTRPLYERLSVSSLCVG